MYVFVCIDVIGHIHMMMAILHPGFTESDTLSTELVSEVPYSQPISYIRPISLV